MPSAVRDVLRAIDNNEMNDASFTATLSYSWLSLISHLHWCAHQSKYCMKHADLAVNWHAV